MKVGIGGALRALIRLDASASTNASLETSFNSGIVATSIISNTVLTDFLSVIEDKDIKKDIAVFSGYQIDTMPDSLSYMALLTPYMAMIRNNKGILAGELELSVDKLDGTIKNAKGYFEFVGSKGTDQIIFRLNNSSFKDNYKASDLPRMDLVICAVLVGESTIEELDISSELNVTPSVAQNNQIM